MEWFLFVLYLHTDKPAEIYRWQFETQAACVNAAEFVSQGNGIKAACIQDGTGDKASHDGSLVRHPLPLQDLREFVPGRD